jgi:hypothetical protein
MPRVRFTCTRCEITFPVILAGSRFTCPRCGSHFRLVQFEKELGWIEEPEGPAWITSPVRSMSENFFVRPGKPACAGLPEEFARPVSGIGLARARVFYRQQRARQNRRLILLLAALVLVVFFMLLNPARLLTLVEHAAAAGMALLPVETQTASAASLTPSPTTLPISTLLPSPTPTSAHTPTPVPSATPTAVPTSTPTRLPDHLVQATEWQNTLDQAISKSAALQTQYAQSYSATLTSLPPTLTAMAIERQATVTETFHTRR